MLAAKILKEQGIKVTALSFKSYFFNSEAAKKAAKNLKIPLMVVDFSKEQLALVRNPKHGYGKTMNPCIDCHALMLKKAKDIMRKKGFDFVATGEVLGERPMSQNRKSLELVEKESSLKGYLLRPLSAKLLPETVSEKKGLVKRDLLFDISGRSRKKQMELAKLWGIKDYPSPAGGCLLTDIYFSQKLKELLAISPKLKPDDLELLRYGRHFTLGKAKIIIGRNEQENNKIRELEGKGDIVIEMEKYPGPTALIKIYSTGKIDSLIIKKAEDFVRSYSTKAKNQKDVRFVKLTK